jgi:hypothetical protein
VPTEVASLVELLFYLQEDVPKRIIKDREAKEENSKVFFFITLNLKLRDSITGHQTILDLYIACINEANNPFLSSFNI